MPYIEFEAYSRWIEKWRPHLVYGASASGGHALQGSGGGPAPVSLSQLPGGDVVRAY